MIILNKETKYSLRERERGKESEIRKEIDREVVTVTLGG